MTKRFARLSILCAMIGGGALWLDGGGNADARVATNTSAATSSPMVAAGTVTFPAGNEGTQKPGEWTMPGRDYGGTRYSPLTDINVSNVKNLKVSTTFSTGVLHGHEGQPLVIGSTMYVVTPFPNLLHSIDLSKPGGVLNGTFQPRPDARSVGIACCDIVNRGSAFADGKIIYSTLDAHTVAVDAKTGKEVWRTRIGDINIGETITGAPLVVGDNVYVGDSGAELGVRGYVQALDVATGKPRWKAYNTGPDKDVLIGANFKPFYAKDRGTDLGVKTWPKDQWKLGGGMGPSLRDSSWYYGGDEASIFASITEGRQNGMPAWGSKLAQSDIWKIVTYIKTMRTPDEPDAPR